MSIRIHSWFAVLAFVGVLGVAEWGARRAMPVTPASEDVPRQKHRFRGWPAFTAWQDAPTGTARIVWLSHSQAYAGEIPANRIYADKLERALTAQRAGGFDKVEVMNWSFDGVTSIEMTLMAARLQRAEPDLVVAAVGMANFTIDDLSRPLSQCRSDLPRLVSHPEIFRALPRTFLRRHVPIEDGLTVAAWDRVALLRFREFAWSWLDQQWGGLQRGLYAPAVNFHPWQLAHLPARGDFGRAPWSKRAGRVEARYDARSRVLLEEFLDLFQSIPARRHLVIATPHHLKPGNAMAPSMEIFRRDLASLAAARGLPLVDDSDLYGAEGFFDGLHFNPDYHQYYCETLFARIKPLLDTP